MLNSYPSSQTYYREMDENLLPYWMDLQTSGVSSPTGGIYYESTERHRTVFDI